MVKTTVNSNLSVKRSISTEGDSIRVQDIAYPFPQNKSWTRIKDDQKYTVEKSFSDITELNQELSSPEDSLAVNTIASLSKKFRWFYTFYRYEETFYSFYPFKLLPIEDYLTPEELQIYYSGKDSSEIEDKIEEWHNHSLFEEFYQVLLNAIKESSYSDISIDSVNSKKEYLYEQLEGWNFESEDFSQYFLETCDKVFKQQHSILILKPYFSDINQQFIRYFRFFEKIFTEDYKITVVMPGRILDTNAGDVQNTQVSWEFEADNFHTRDYQMWVESRRFNIFPTIITAMFVLIIIFILCLSARQSYRKKLEAKGIDWATRKRFILNKWISALFIIIGIALMVFFTKLYIEAHTIEGVILFFIPLNLFNDRDQKIFLILIFIGVLFLLFGLFHLLRWFKYRRHSNS